MGGGGSKHVLHVCAAVCRQLSRRHTHTHTHVCCLALCVDVCEGRRDTKWCARRQPQRECFCFARIGSSLSLFPPQIHDAQLDYYGRRLATCSSDRLVKVRRMERRREGEEGRTKLHRVSIDCPSHPPHQVFDVAGDAVTQLAELAGHEGPVWSVAWAHPQFGSLLASASFDGRVALWRDDGPSRGWARAPDAATHTASVNAVAFAPPELGLALAAASSDGSVSVATGDPSTGAWARAAIEGAHPGGALAVAWAPPSAAAVAASARAAAGGGGGGAADPPPEARLATAGCDGTARVWRKGGDGRWTPDGAPLTAHGDWVRDVAWAPSLAAASGGATLATAGQDGRVFIWTEAAPGAGWAAPTLLHDFGAPVWRVAWSLSGGVLAATDGKGGVTLWKESVDGAWEQVTAPVGVAQ